MDLGYIDGCHDFDHAFIDFFYLDRMIPAGGILGFNDAGWPTVFKVIRYLQKHREYKEMDVGLKPDYSARNVFLSAARRVLSMPRQDRYFCKARHTEWRCTIEAPTEQPRRAHRLRGHPSKIPAVFP